MNRAPAMVIAVEFTVRIGDAAALIAARNGGHYWLQIPDIDKRLEARLQGHDQEL